ncbi:hypothetical protein [Parasitella parasitica]|uniref:MARVEL domain-containing protein n=1 Tax=Parasitella parasitica TaxID=35722 RepID=A0A0B7N8H0_9FUNG|nr:hypothetical protein [Parasitella parasitica]
MSAYRESKYPDYFNNADIAWQESPSNPPATLLKEKPPTEQESYRQPNGEENKVKASSVQPYIQDFSQFNNPTGTRKIAHHLRTLSEFSSFALIVWAIGHFSFALGASPYSGQPIPFKSGACFHFLCTVAVMSFIYSCFRAYLAICKCEALAQKKLIYFVVDAVFLVMWGSGIVGEWLYRTHL